MIADPPPPIKARKRPPRAAGRLVVALGMGAIAGTIAGFSQPWQTAPLAGWDAAALTWVASVWLGISGLNAVDTRAHATSEDPSRAMADVALLSAAVTSLAAVVVGVIKSGKAQGSDKFVLLAAGILTIVVSWAVVHTLFTLRYAAVYYTGGEGGVDFKENDEPDYRDFAYMAFTVGMTYQVSDTDLTTKAIRRTALRHALLSYVFGTVIIAATINLAAGLVK